MSLSSFVSLHTHTHTLQLNPKTRGRNYSLKVPAQSKQKVGSTRCVADPPPTPQLISFNSSCKAIPPDPLIPNPGGGCFYLPSSPFPSLPQLVWSLSPGDPPSTHIFPGLLPLKSQVWRVLSLPASGPIQTIQPLPCKCALAGDLIKASRAHHSSHHSSKGGEDAPGPHPRERTGSNETLSCAPPE